MKAGLYVVKDVVAQVFSAPLVARTELAASRQYILLLKEGKFNQQDFELFQIGTYDEDTGVADTHAPVKVVPVYKKDADLVEVMP